MKKILKWAGALLGIGLITLVIYGWSVHEPKPKGQAGPEAEALAQKMIKAVNKQAWDETGVVQWTFKDAREFLWDKKRNFVRVRWSDKEVLLNAGTVQGVAFKDGKLVAEEKNQKLVEKAWSYFCNDSFWFNAPVKAFDPGTERSLVTLKDGRKGLMVSYSSGGVTPGDSYVWLLDENGRPTSWKMWVQISPVGGAELSWEDWIQLPTGAWVASMHKGALFSLDMGNIDGRADLADMGFEKDPFADLLK